MVKDINKDYLAIEAIHYLLDNYTIKELRNKDAL